MRDYSLLFFFLFILVSNSLLRASVEIDSLLEDAYNHYTFRSFDLAIDAASAAQDLAHNLQDSLNFKRAEFYNDISTQLQKGDQYDIELINQYRDYFLKNNLEIEYARASVHLGRIYYYLGDVQKELAQYMKALKIYEERSDEVGMADVYSGMSLMYYDQHDYDAAFEYIKKAIQIDKVGGKLRRLSRDYNNYAIIYEDVGPIDSAIIYHEKALDLAYRSKDTYGIGLSLSNLGNNYVISNQPDKAKYYLFKALNLRDSIGYSRGLAYTHNRLGKLFNKLGELSKAQYHAEQSYFYANQIDELKVTRMSYQLLGEIAAARNDHKSEMFYYKKRVALEDSLQNNENTKALTKMVLLHQFDKKSFADSLARVEEARLMELAHQEEIQQKNRIRNYLFLSAIFLLMVAGGLFSRWRYIRNSRDIISKEKERSENLLLNILPAEVAQELKDKGKAEARNFERASILFTDFITFTQNSEKLSASELVEELNICFESFDSILDKYKIEKIKTIGDAYMAAGGIPVPSEESVKHTVLAALEMQSFIEKRRREKLGKGQLGFEMRVGINTGPVVAGIVGTKKFQYDVWGDTVNTASRIESLGQGGKVNISKTTFELLKDDPEFTFESRGKIRAKGKGEIEMYFVDNNLLS